jgi:aminopeptidase N
MENQTLSVFGRDIVEMMAEDDERDIIVPHELAHQWLATA